MPHASRTAQRRAAAANRARAALPKRRRATASETLARRGTVVLGVLVVVALVIGAIATYSASGTPLSGSNATADRRGDPNALIAAVTANPQSADALIGLADYYSSTGQSSNALPLYQHYLQLRPDDAHAHVSIGELLLAGGDTPGAQTQFAQAIALKPDAPIAAEAHLGLGNAYAVLTPPRLPDALNELTTAANLDPTGDIGSAARDRLASIQAQYGIATVTVAVPAIPTIPSFPGLPTVPVLTKP